MHEVTKTIENVINLTKQLKEATKALNELQEGLKELNIDKLKIENKRELYFQLYLCQELNSNKYEVISESDFPTSIDYDPLRCFVFKDKRYLYIEI